MGRRFANASNRYFVNSTACPVTTTPFTLSCWARATDTDSRGILSIGKTGTTERHLLYNNSTIGLTAFSGDSGGFGQATSGSGNQVSSTVYSHCAGVWEAFNLRRVYFNGSETGNDVGPATTTGLDRIYIGTYYNNGVQTSFSWSGDICEVALWNVALGPGEIKSLSEGRSPLLTRPGALVGYWPLHGRETDEEDWIGAARMTNTNSAVEAPHGRIIMPPFQMALRGTGGDAPAAARPYFFFMT